MAAAKQTGKGVAVIIPAGTFEIRQTISIGGSGVVLRGSGVRVGCMPTIVGKGCAYMDRRSSLPPWWPGS